MTHAEILALLSKELNLLHYSSGGRLKITLPDNTQVHLAIVQVKPAGKCLTCPKLIPADQTHCDFCAREMT